MIVDETNTAHEKNVQVGVREGEMVQVLYALQPDATIEGVQPGERVVTVGRPRVGGRREGARGEARATTRPAR